MPGIVLAADYRDVAPILARRCVACHQRGEIGPMALATYSEARPWAKAIREAVQLRRMPPWFAHEASVRFANDASLPEDERQAIVDWVNGGAREGAPVRALPAKRAVTGKPDLILQSPVAFRVAPGDVVEYQYLILPVPGEGVDRWVRRVEIRPSARSIVHHIVAYVREKESAWLRDAPRGRMHVPPVGERQTKADILAVYTPGARAVELPEGMAKKLPASAEIVLQFHYTAARAAATDRTSVALEFAREAPARRVLTLQMGVDDLEIEPGDRRYRRSVSGTLPNDALLLSLMPHMHLRGSEFEFEIVGDGGRVERLLWVKPFDFYWQLTYQLAAPRLLRKGTRLRFTGTFDNSAGNARNPDPRAVVRWGEQSWEEMMIGFFDVAVETGLDKAAFSCDKGVMRRFALTLLFAAGAFGCSCVSNDVKPACAVLGESDIVFRGTVIDHDGGRKRVGALYRVAVKEIFKGLPAGTTTIFIDTWGPCATDYVASEYLFFLRGRLGKAGEAFHLPYHQRLPHWKGLEDMPLSVDGMCSATRAISGDEPDLAYLRGPKPRTGWITGKVVPNHNYGDLERIAEAPGVAGLEIRARHGNRRFATRTNAEGHFEIPALAAGDYDISIHAPDYLRSYFVYAESPVRVSPGYCVEANGSVTTANSISGRVLRADGKPLTNARLSAGLIRGDKVVKLRPWADTDEMGRFTFPALLAYEPVVIGINVNGPPTETQPYDAVFAPGTSEVAKAQVFRLKPFDRVENVTLRLPPPLPQGRLYVEVYWPNGTPAIGGARALAIASLARDLDIVTDSAKGTNVVKLTLTPGRDYEIHADYYRQTPYWATDATPVKVRFVRDGQRIRLVLNESKPN